jgi:hypothetical protein
MISLDVNVKESLERDNLLSCEAIVMACTGFEYWLVALSMALSTGSKSVGVKVLLRCGSVMAVVLLLSGVIPVGRMT